MRHFCVAVSLHDSITISRRYQLTPTLRPPPLLFIMLHVTVYFFSFVTVSTSANTALTMEGCREEEFSRLWFPFCPLIASGDTQSYKGKINAKRSLTSPTFNMPLTPPYGAVIMGEEDPRNSEDPIKAVTSGPSAQPQSEDNRDADDSTKLIQVTDGNNITNSNVQSAQNTNRDSTESNLNPQSGAEVNGNSITIPAPERDTQSQEPDPSDSEPLLPQSDSSAPSHDVKEPANHTQASSAPQPEKVLPTPENSGTPRRKRHQRRPLSSPASLRHGAKSESANVASANADQSHESAEKVKLFAGQDRHATASAATSGLGGQVSKSESDSPKRWGRSVSHEEPSRAKTENSLYTQQQHQEKQQQQSATSTTPGIQHNLVLKELTSHSRFQASEQRVQQLTADPGHKSAGSKDSQHLQYQHQYLTEQQQLTLQRLQQQEQIHQKQRQQQRQRQNQQQAQQQLHHRENQSVKDANFKHSPQRYPKESIQQVTGQTSRAERGNSHQHSHRYDLQHNPQYHQLQSEQYKQQQQKQQQQQQQQQRQEGNLSLYHQYQLYQHEAKKEQQQKYFHNRKHHFREAHQEESRFHPKHLSSHPNGDYELSQPINIFHHDINLHHEQQQQQQHQQYQQQQQHKHHTQPNIHGEQPQQTQGQYLKFEQQKQHQERVQQQHQLQLNQYQLRHQYQIRQQQLQQQQQQQQPHQQIWHQQHQQKEQYQQQLLYNQHSQEQIRYQERLLLQQKQQQQQQSPQRGHDISHSSSTPSTFTQQILTHHPHPSIEDKPLQATRSFERGRSATKHPPSLPAGPLSIHTVQSASSPSSSSSSLIAATKSLIPNNIGSYSSSDQHAVYANVRAPNGAPFGLGPVGLEMGIKSMEVEDDSFVVETVEIIKRPGQTLGFYIREGNGYDRTDGVFISRIQMGTVAQSNGLLHVGDEIVTVNNVQVGNMSLDDVVILMSIPKKLVLTIRTRRSSSKNKSCPALPVIPAERPEPPIVVLKKGRSSSASALEMTEKCPDMFEPGQAFAQYPLQAGDYIPRRDIPGGSSVQDRRAAAGAGGVGAVGGGNSPSSRYASIFISPGRAEAKLLSDDGMDSSNSSNDGSLPRSVASSKGGAEARPGHHVGQDVNLGESPLHHSYQQHLQHYPGGYMSVTNPIYDQFPDRELRPHWPPEPEITMGRKAGGMPKSPSRPGAHGHQGSMGGAGTGSSGFRSVTGAGLQVPHGLKEPPYMNIGAIREGLPHHHRQQHGYQHHSHHQQPQIQQQFHSQMHPHQFPSTSPGHQFPFQPSHQQQQQQHSVSVYPQSIGGGGESAGSALSQHYRGGMPLSVLSQEDRRGQERLRSLLSSSKSRYGRLLRSRSPEGCYNSDSELMFSRDQHQTQPQDGGRGFASDYETYGGAFSDDEPVYSIPRVPSSSSSELEMLLKKFTTLSQELQQEQSRLKRQLSSRDKGGGNLLTRTDSLSGDEYGYPSTSGQASPVPVRRAAATQTAGLQPRLSRNVSLDAQSSAASFLYGTSQHESHPDLSGRVSHGNMAISTSQTSAQLAGQQQQGTLEEHNTSAASQVISSRLRDLHLTRKPLHIPYSEFEPYKVDMRKRMETTRSGGLDGLLSVHIMSGQGLKSSKTSLRDLYCVVAVDSLNKARTMIRTGAINFDWDEAFDVDLEDSKEVSFLIYHWDPHFKHRLCFHGSILLPGYVLSSHKRHVAIKLEPKGILFVTLLYKEPAISLQRLPSVRKNALFGVELETVILREASGLNVPRLVHKCVLEVERRGLETVGIYRLCGSARRKAMLREAFQIDSAGVDLSAENVSDIHVITGVLKDYLRELPEPLFTNALYQMLVDALSVRMPCDPEGSAKLMLSILECLPSANQDTMALLLNHLRRIAAHSEKNKMGIDNLAICFGPVLLCPAPNSTPDPLLDFRKHIEVLRYLLEIWDYDGSSSTGTSKSPTVDTVVSMETGESSLQAVSGQQGPQPDQSKRSLGHDRGEDASRQAGGVTALEGNSPRH
ncbi:rho GTPase-activating protein 100f-like [Plakobranchus ocellatus]|uniref:Rho GTPase-activating protein 100f-like n=1 Tax=Plakobranchus ocellatus TaxID=259542 RepID=A0AAV4BG12_9GAST|nr:rho GTPase-activating protein 100f-like [Plakobranchus ocellatus]